MNEITLAGCTATPLAGYLKAIGVLRLLSTNHPKTRGFWRGDQFALRTPLDRAAIEDFLLREYRPTPILAPWNGGSGFYEKDNKAALEAIRLATSPRFEGYKECLDIVDAALAGMDRSASPKGEDKALLLSRIRSNLPDIALTWLDASVLLAHGTAQYPPLLGTGGNDGRLDFTNNFMQRVIDVIGTGDHSPPAPSDRWLRTSLFANPAPDLSKSAIGQFSPGQAGGPNGTIGFDADAAMNPWDFVLMIEGSVAFAAATVRRNAHDPYGTLSYPFTVRSVGAGSGAIGESDAVTARGELWMPLWTQAATWVEVQALLAEGRVALGTKPARDAVDFARAVQSLGGYRGIRSFQRYGLLMRSGKAFLATPLGRMPVNDAPVSPWLNELDRNGWLDRFRRFAHESNTATRFKVLGRRLEDVLFDLAGKSPSKPQAQLLLILLGEIHLTLAASSKAREAVQPLPRMSEHWINAADDQTPAFRVAKALAGLRGTKDEPLPLRAQIFPIQRHIRKWVTPDSSEKHRMCDGFRGRLVDALPALLTRRLWLAEMLQVDKPLDSPAGTTLDDVAAFLRDSSMDERIADLLPALALCDIPRDTDHAADDGVVPAAFALLKLNLVPDRLLYSLGILPDGTQLPVSPNMLAQLAAGNQNNRAVAAAWCRLQGSGLGPMFSTRNLPTLAGIDPKRAAAALLIPLRYGAIRQLANAVLKQPEPESV